MAIFDESTRRIFVRIAYDGVELAGKTTNLRRLCELFAARRRGDLVSSPSFGDPALYFDWVEITYGASCGFPLVCQLVAVPGQTVLAPLRRHILEAADGIVHVCDSTLRAAQRARSGLELLQDVLAVRPRDVPLIVQANKQDKEGASSASLLRQSLGLVRDVPVVPARAMDGAGVLETFVYAVRQVAACLDERRRAGAEVPTGRPESAEELRRSLGHRILSVADWARSVLTSDDVISGPSLRPGSLPDVHVLRPTLPGLSELGVVPRPPRLPHSLLAPALGVTSSQPTLRPR